MIYDPKVEGKAWSVFHISGTELKCISQIIRISRKYITGESTNIKKQFRPQLPHPSPAEQVSTIYSSMSSIVQDSEKRRKFKNAHIRYKI